MEIGANESSLIFGRVHRLNKEIRRSSSVGLKADNEDQDG